MDVINWIIRIPILFGDFITEFIKVLFAPIDILTWHFCLADLLGIAGIGILVALMVYSIAKI